MPTDNLNLEPDGKLSKQLGYLNLRTQHPYSTTMERNPHHKTLNNHMGLHSKPGIFVSSRLPDRRGSSRNFGNSHTGPAITHLLRGPILDHLHPHNPRQPGTRSPKKKHRKNQHAALRYHLNCRSSWKSQLFSGPTHHINVKMLRNIISGIPLMLGLRTRM